MSQLAAIVNASEIVGGIGSNASAVLSESTAAATMSEAAGSEGLRRQEELWSGWTAFQVNLPQHILEKQCVLQSRSFLSEHGHLVHVADC